MFIQELSKYLENSDINITFSKNGDIITAIVLPKPKNDKIDSLSPIVAKGTAEQLENSLLPALKTVFDAIDEFKIVGVTEAVEAIKTDEETATRPDKAPKAKVEKVAAVKIEKINPKTVFEEAGKLFTEGKYSEALPLYKQASELKPDSKPYKEAFNNCQRWVDSVAKMNVSNQEFHVDPGTETIGEVLDNSPIDEEAVIEVSEMTMLQPDNVQEEEDDFAV